MQYSVLLQRLVDKVKKMQEGVILHTGIVREDLRNEIGGH